MKQGKSPSITDSRIKTLNDIDFSWSGEANNISWDKKYDELKQFKCRKGHCNIPYRFTENPSLGIWVRNQRYQYKLIKEGKPSSMNKSRIKALEDIGFIWRVNDPGCNAKDNVNIHLDNTNSKVQIQLC